MSMVNCACELALGQLRKARKLLSKFQCIRCTLDSWIPDPAFDPHPLTTIVKAQAQQRERMQCESIRLTIVVIGLSP